MIYTPSASNRKAVFYSLARSNLNSSLCFFSVLFVSVNVFVRAYIYIGECDRIYSFLRTIYVCCRYHFFLIWGL